MMQFDEKCVQDAWKLLFRFYHLHKVAILADTKAKYLFEAGVQSERLKSFARQSPDPAITALYEHSKDVLKLMHGERMVQNQKGIFVFESELQ
jgi:hypothetical protein